MENISTSRLNLRSFKIDDVNEVFFLRSDKEVGQFIKRPKLQDTDGALLFINRISNEVANGKIHHWVITKKNSDKMIGSICLWNFNEERTKAEVGYDLYPNAQGQGIMDESMKHVLRFAFDTLKLSVVYAYTDHRNKASIRLLEKNNFKIEPELRDEGNENNRIFVLSYQLI